MGGSASYRLARKIAKARENGESQDVIDELERQRQTARERERNMRKIAKEREEWIKAHTLERTDEEKGQIRNVAATSVEQAETYLNKKVRLTEEEYSAIRSVDARNAYYRGAKDLAKNAEKYDYDPETLLFKGSPDAETRKFWSDYVKYLDSFF